MRRHLIDLQHEEFWIIMLGQSQKVLGKELISKGGIAATLADARIIFHAALQHQATSIILVHNHPSGSLKPSHEDIVLTKKLAEAGKLLDIRIQDHLIITDSGFLSLADEAFI